MLSVINTAPHFDSASSAGGLLICLAQLEPQVLRYIAARDDGSPSEAVGLKRDVSHMAHAIACDMAGVGSLAHADNGKPFFPDRPELVVSISHSGHTAAVSIDNHRHGIDLERITAMRPKLAARFYTANEQAFIDCAENNDAAFFRIWTLKEAIIKATDHTLGELVSIETCTDGDVRLQYIDRSGCVWHLSSCVQFEHMLSVCSERNSHCDIQPLSVVQQWALAEKAVALANSTANDT